MRRFPIFASVVAFVSISLALASTVQASAEEQALSGDKIPTSAGELVIDPIRHATLVMQWNGKTIYIDPVGGAKSFTGLPKPDLILVTHMHGDHFDVPTLQAIVPHGAKTPLVVPKSVAEKCPAELQEKATVKILANDEKTDVAGIGIEAIPSYNITVGKEKFHPKGRDNGYVLTMGGKRVYIAGDTEDTPEMRALKDIDVAFLPMNLPYTMTVAKAAEAIREFKPKIIYPYHYRSGDGTKADLNELKNLVGGDVGVEVRARDWYLRK
jgi:L-ascorbate metabolism protein UlaG (beta-lactamase superfamily)